MLSLASSSCKRNSNCSNLLPTSFLNVSWVTINFSLFAFSFFTCFKTDSILSRKSSRSPSV
uniref:LEF-Autographa californica nuclear polyhedrosis virus late expression factor (lef-1) gene and ecdysteroid UDP-glucosyltransferase genes n=1 Tax=Autographa californica nuclear polyhedrosis virus TaxID=46015 RepID=Q65341_NPVAC|nr:5.7 kDa ORF [Autographa californica nucleopolyhedrovirus]